MMELNPLEQGCLPEFFTGDLKCYCLLLEKKAYLIDFSFKFNEIKFCSLLMNWLIREKMFTYFYNKFRPVNQMHHIKYGVNSSLLTYFWLPQKVCGTLGHTHFSQRGWLTNLLWCDIPQNKAPRTGPHHIWRIYTLCHFSGHEKNTDSSGVWLMISLPSACYGNSRVAKHLLRPNLVFQPIWGWGNLGSFQLPQSNSSPGAAWNLSGYI